MKPLLRMTVRCFLPAVLFCMVAFTSWAVAELNVVASIPDLADMGRIIGGDSVRVVSLTTGREDLHAVPVRPSFIPKINRADILLNLGLDAEHAWLPALAADARNRRVMEGGKGWVEVGQGISVLETPEKWDRAEGHQHPLGNPHFNVGPQCGRAMAKNIASAFIEHDPGNETKYRENLHRYVQELTELKAELLEKGATLKGQTVISYHPDVAYLCAFYGMQKIGSIEPKPGVQPTSRHMAYLADLVRTRGVRLIIYNQTQNPRLPENLAERSGAKAVQFANAVGAKPQINSWIDLQRYNLNALLGRLER
jgi:ABC-type Zn uptake system ZnuABC Zn-binding protein ZnuA